MEPTKLREPPASHFQLSTFNSLLRRQAGKTLANDVIPTEATRLFLPRVLYAPGRVGRDPGKTRNLLPGRWNQRSSKTSGFPLSTFNFRLFALPLHTHGKILSHPFRPASRRQNLGPFAPLHPLLCLELTSSFFASRLGTPFAPSPLRRLPGWVPHSPRNP